MVYTDPLYSTAFPIPENDRRQNTLRIFLQGRGQTSSCSFVDGHFDM